MDALERMKESRRRIMLKHGEFNPVLLRLKLKEDDSPLNLYKTAYTDGKVIGFHPDFIAKLDKDQLDTLQMHECFHVAFLHCFSQRTKFLREKDLEWFFEAEDHVVNNILLEARFKPIDKWICDVKYSGWSLEQVFEDLKQQNKKPQPTLDFHLAPVDENTLSAEEKQKLAEVKKDWQKALADVIVIAKQKGTLGAGLSKLVDESLESQIPWTRILVDNLHRRLGKSETTWNRPSRRGRVLDMYLPSAYDLQVNCVVVCFDTSGSMWNDDLLPQAFAEVKSLCRQMNVKRLVLIQADNVVCEGFPKEVDDSTALDTTLHGGGGTSFVPALALAQNYEPDLIVYFTDLEGTFPEAEIITSNVLWVTKSQDEVPFGEALRIK